MGKATYTHYASARHLSCEGCRTRKAKCSRTFPCVSCAVRGIECVWQDTAPAHGIVQASLEENFAEIERLNKVIRQLSTLLYERDPFFSVGLLGGDAATATGMYPMVLPPTPPGLDYLPDPSAYVEYGRTHRMPPPPPPPPPPPRFAPEPQASRARVYTAPAMQRSQSEYGYTFGTASNRGDLHPPLAGLNQHPVSAHPQYPVPQYQILETSSRVTSISPTEVSPISAAAAAVVANRSRSTTWPSSLLLTSQPPLPHALSYLHATAAEPTQQYSPHEPFLAGASALSDTRPAAPLSSSPHSHKFDAAVMLASGLAANATLDEAHATVDESDYFASAEQDRDTSPATAARVDGEPTNAELTAAADLAQLASTSLAYRRPSAVVAGYDDDHARHTEGTATPADGERSRLNGTAEDDEWFFPLPVH